MPVKKAVHSAPAASKKAAEGKSAHAKSVEIKPEKPDAKKGATAPKPVKKVTAKKPVAPSPAPVSEPTCSSVAGKVKVGTASWYTAGSKAKVANGAKYNADAFGAAMVGVPLGTRVRVTGSPKGSGETHSVVVEVNDTGGFAKPTFSNGARVIDLTPKAAKVLGIGPKVAGKDPGLAKVTVEACSPPLKKRPEPLPSIKSASSGVKKPFADVSGLFPADVMIASAPINRVMPPVKSPTGLIDNLFLSALVSPSLEG